VGLPSEVLTAFADASDAVYEPFAGSGTTMMAAEQTGLICYGMEISPAYVDVAVKRWSKFTGRRADFLAVFPLAEKGRARLIGTVRDERADHADTLKFEDVSDRAITKLKVNVQKVNWFSTYHVHHRVTEQASALLRWSSRRSPIWAISQPC
jgi:hypothetical protein